MTKIEKKAFGIIQKVQNVYRFFQTCFIKNLPGTLYCNAFPTGKPFSESVPQIELKLQSKLSFYILFKFVLLQSDPDQTFIL